MRKVPILLRSIAFFIPCIIVFYAFSAQYDSVWALEQYAWFLYFFICFVFFYVSKRDGVLHRLATYGSLGCFVSIFLALALLNISPQAEEAKIKQKVEKRMAIASGTLLKRSEEPTIMQGTVLNFAEKIGDGKLLVVRVLVKREPTLVFFDPTSPSCEQKNFVVRPGDKIDIRQVWFRANLKSFWYAPEGRDPSLPTYFVVCK